MATIQNKQENKLRFKRIATNRTNEVLEKLRILGNCSDRRTYDYTDEEVEKMFKAIDEQLKMVKAKFKKPKKGFKF